MKAAAPTYGLVPKTTAFAFAIDIEVTRYYTYVFKLKIKDLKKLLG